MSDSEEERSEGEEEEEAPAPPQAKLLESDSEDEVSFFHTSCLPLFLFMEFASLSVQTYRCSYLLLIYSLLGMFPLPPAYLSPAP